MWGEPHPQGHEVKVVQQIVWNNAQQIAASYPDAQKARYQAAAQILRVPYWDWATHATSTMPDVVSQPVITINTPKGSQSIVNPLYNYTFHPLPSAPDFPSNEIVSRSIESDKLAHARLHDFGGHGVGYFSTPSCMILTWI